MATFLSDGYDSPTTVDTQLEYITVESYNWPKPPPPNRARLDEQERRRRHCECQKRFLARKRHFVEQLRRDVATMELQVKLLEAMRETKELREEQQQLLLQQVEVKNIPVVPLETTTTLEPHEQLHHEALKSLDVDDLLAVLGLP